MRSFNKPKLFFLFALLICGFNSYSQQFFDYLTQPEKSESYVLLREERKEYAFGLIDAKQNLKWELPVPGVPLGMGKLGNDVIVLYAEEYKNFHPMKVIHAMLVETAKKKVLKDDVIYTNPGKTGIQVEVLQDPRGNLSCVLVRLSTLNQAIGGFARFGIGGSFEKSKTLTMIIMGDKLVSKTKDLNSIVLESDYMASSAGNNNELYVCSYSKGQLTAEKFNGNGNKIGQLATDVAYHQKFEGNFFAQYDSLQQNCFDLALAYTDDKKDPMNRLFRFDFNNKKVNANDPIPNDKDYVKSLKATNADSKLSHFGAIKSLKPVQILNTPDQTLFFKEIQTATTDEKGNTSAHMREGAIISVYSKDLKLIKDIPISKYSTSHLRSFDQIHGYAKGGRLYVVTNEQNGLGYSTFLYTINLTDFSMTSKNIPDPESGVKWMTNPGNVLWYNTNFLIPFLKIKESINIKLDTKWVSENY